MIKPLNLLKDLTPDRIILTLKEWRTPVPPRHLWMLTIYKKKASLRM